MPLQVLLDTSVLRAGFVSDAGASRRLLLATFTGRTTAIASTALMLECEEVLLRPETLERAGVSARRARLPRRPLRRLPARGGAGPLATAVA